MAGAAAGMAGFVLREESGPRSIADCGRSQAASATNDSPANDMATERARRVRPGQAELARRLSPILAWKGSGPDCDPLGWLNWNMNLRFA